MIKRSYLIQRNQWKRKTQTNNSNNNKNGEER